MKKNILNLFVLISFTAFVSCSSSSPGDVAESFFKKMYAGDFEAAKELATSDTKSMLTMMESFGAKDKMKDELKGGINIEVTDTEIDGDNATCKLMISDDSGDKKEETTVKLVKEDGKWLVNMGKEDAKKEGMAPKMNSGGDE